MPVINETSDLVSVIIPSRNRRVRLARAIESVQQQRWPNIEIIVIDDASTDDTTQFLKKLVDTSAVPIKFIRNEVPQGGAGARNSGIDLAEGQYIAFLDDDDIWMPEKLSLQIEMMKANPSASSVSCSFFVQHSSGRQTVKYISSPKDVQQILNTNHLGGASMCLTTRQMLCEIGGFDAGLRSAQDWDLWIKLNDRGKVLVCSEPLVKYVYHQGVTITSNPHSKYAGRRRLYIRYKERMTAATRKHHLCELIFCRKVLLQRFWMRKLSGLTKVFGFSGLVIWVSFFYRTLKLAVADFKKYLWSIE